MRANNRRINLSYDRQREYQRQQERLKAMSGKVDKVKSVSADLMIENIFKNSSQSSHFSEKAVNVGLDLPLWLQCDSPLVPPQYKYLWSLVQFNLEMADTQKVSQLLLTSGLQTEVLGYIWNLANKVVPGQLTKQEFYIVLALVNLAQTGCAFNNLSILKLLTTPIVPALQVNSLQGQIPYHYAETNSNPMVLNTFPSMHDTSIQPKSAFIEKKDGLSGPSIITSNSHISSPTDFIMKEDTYNSETIKSTYLDQINNKLTKINESSLSIKKESQGNLNFPCIGSSPTIELEDDFSEFQSVPPDKKEDSQIVDSGSINNEFCDEFTDFQSANVEISENTDPFKTVVISQKKEIPIIPFPKNFSGKLSTLKSSILKISPESERKLKLLSPNESLSSLPESKISSSNKVSTSISVLGNSHGIGSRLANHSLNMKLERPKIHKHHKNKSNLPSSPGQNPKAEEIIFGVKTANLETIIPKCCPMKSNNSKLFVLKDTKISNVNDEAIAVEYSNSENSNEYDNPVTASGENTRKIEIPMLGTLNETVLPSQTFDIDLIMVQEDKYSALREIELTAAESKKEMKYEAEVMNDDFGDFLSAGVSLEVTPNKKSVDVLQHSSVVLSKQDDGENWGDWNFNTETNLGVNSLPSLENSDMPELISVTNSDNFSKNAANQNNFSSFDLLCLEEKINVVELSKPMFSENENYDKTTSKTEDLDLDLNEGLGNVQNISIATSSSAKVSTSQSDNEFLDFVSPPTKPTNSDLSRHGSLPSLDLKMLPCEESDQECIWRKCLETCQIIVQEGSELFDSILKKPLLDEICATPETSNYLNGLKIAYQISKRITQKYSYALSVQEDMDRLWRKLEELSFEYNIQLDPDIDSVTEGKNHCSICLGAIECDIINQGTHSYHPSCANLWINCVEVHLPCPT